MVNMNLTQFHATKAQAQKLARKIGLQYKRTFSDSRKGGWRYKFWAVEPGETADGFFTALTGLFAHQDNVTVYFSPMYSRDFDGKVIKLVNFYVQFRNVR